MNVDYVSKRFFKEAGRKFSDYLTDIRIMRAKEYIAAGEKDSDHRRKSWLRQ